jgi:hypothetical protein
LKKELFKIIFLLLLLFITVRTLHKFFKLYVKLGYITNEFHLKKVMEVTEHVLMKEHWVRQVENAAPRSLEFSTWL